MEPHNWKIWNGFSWKSQTLLSEKYDFGEFPQSWRWSNAADKVWIKPLPCWHWIPPFSKTCDGHYLNKFWLQVGKWMNVIPFTISDLFVYHWSRRWVNHLEYLTESSCVSSKFIFFSPSKLFRLLGSSGQGISELSF